MIPSHICASVCRAHYYLQELFVDPAQLMSSVQPGGGGGNMYGGAGGGANGNGAFGEPQMGQYGLTPAQPGKQCKHNLWKLSFGEIRG
jgi:hypothetical protein